MGIKLWRQGVDVDTKKSKEWTALHVATFEWGYSLDAATHSLHRLRHPYISQNRSPVRRTKGAINYIRIDLRCRAHSTTVLQSKDRDLLPMFKLEKARMDRAFMTRQWSGMQVWKIFPKVRGPESDTARSASAQGGRSSKNIIETLTLRMLFYIGLDLV